MATVRARGSRTARRERPGARKVGSFAGVDFQLSALTGALTPLYSFWPSVNSSTPNGPMF